MRVPENFLQAPFLLEKENNMIDQNGRFIINDYGKKPTFSSFLPGISGIRGIPIWSFYTNRGQAICSFGTEDKEHSIMEFYPAQQAYQNTATSGFRTFIKVEEEYYEPFREAGSGKTQMFIGKNELEIQEINEKLRLQVIVRYITLPGEELGGLVRQIRILNLDTRERTISYLDGMPALLPCGVSLTNMKEMGQTVKAWMMVEDAPGGIPFYKVRASIKDSTIVSTNSAGHFYLTVDECGSILPAIVDPELVFSYDTSWNKPIGFWENDLELLLQKEQRRVNILPCGFFGRTSVISAGGELMQTSIIGKADNKEVLADFMDKCKNPTYVPAKYLEAIEVTERICRDIKTKTACREFDLYCEQTYLDNLLRGGYPYKIGEHQSLYLYGRKHGDLERDYNFFQMLPENYSQGNGNFRDMNQNRRCDILFHPFLKDKNIKTFYNLLQIDGYNPLQIQKSTYFLDNRALHTILDQVEESGRNMVEEFLADSFTPGSLEKGIRRNKIKLLVDWEAFLAQVMDYATEEQNAAFGEGYWTDHWTYNLDQIESYLNIYPEEEERLLFKDKTYTYYKTKAWIRPRKERYILTEEGVRQHHAVLPDSDVYERDSFLRKENGEIYNSSLMAKLILLATLKTATLDPYGMGIEMEGGKPGWYDALNGLPAMFGSSMAETYELFRMNQFILNALRKYSSKVELLVETFQFMEHVNALLEHFFGSKKDNANFIFWDLVNHEKEQFRNQTKQGVSGKTIEVSGQKLSHMISLQQTFIEQGMNKAFGYTKDICPTYFYYELVDYERLQNEIIPKRFQVRTMPEFLEGSVRYFKISSSKDQKERKRTLYQNIRESTLFDPALKMYKVNGSLEGLPLQMGRAKAFTPGWLENESIWLHMEYKYLLELLRAGLYKEYMQEFRTVGVPFLDEEVYGRSILENSSFLASSAGPDKTIHGRGFVARLSGASVEFIHMWHIMMFGEHPFEVRDSVLILSFKPIVPDYLIGKDKQIQAVFLGQTDVTYRMKKQGTLIPEHYKILEYHMTFYNGDQTRITGCEMIGADAIAVREGMVKSIEVVIANEHDF